MKIKELIKLLEHTKNKIGEEAELILQFGHGDKHQQFDFGDRGREGYMITPYETNMHVDGWGRYICSIKRIPPLKATPEIKIKYQQSWKEWGFSPETILKNERAQDEFYELKYAEYLTNK